MAGLAAFGRPAEMAKQFSVIVNVCKEEENAVIQRSRN